MWINFGSAQFARPLPWGGIKIGATKLLAHFYSFSVAAVAPSHDTTSVVMQSTRVHSSRRRGLGCFTGLLLALTIQGAGTKKEPGEKFFTELIPRTFHFEIPEATMAQLRRSPRTYVSTTVREGDRVLTNVAVRVKGMGSFRTIDEKPSLVVKFDEFATNQHYRGLRKLMFNNSVQDSTYLAELLATQMFRDAGVPAARGTHARVTLNGRDLGLFVVFEAMNKQFLKQHFPSGNGNLYETYVRDIDVTMEQDGGSDTSQSDVAALLAACRISELAARWRELQKVLDVDRFISFAAMEVLTSHWDGYVMHTNNFRLYHDPVTDKFAFITHGIDWAFRRPNISIHPPPKSLVGRAVLETPEGQRLFRERLGTLFTNYFRGPVITNRLEQALAKIRRANLNASDLEKIERRAIWLRQQIEARAAKVSEQLRGIPLAPMKFGPDGTVSLSETNRWRDEPDRGDARMDRGKVDGHNALHIAARNERTRASWRAQVYLARGWYRFEGLARTETLSGGSVRLRISGDTRSVGIADTRGSWRPLTHDFEVVDTGMDIEFVCELTAMQGEVWFDIDSLKVRKLNADEARPANNLRRTILEQ